MSLLEVTTAWAVDERGASRKRAATLLGTIAFLIGIPSALANGAVGWLSQIPGVGLDFLSLLFTIFGQYSLVIGALLISVFVGWIWGVKNAGEEVKENDGQFPLGRTWSFLIRFVCPVAIVAILVSLVRTLLA